MEKTKEVFMCVKVTVPQDCDADELMKDLTLTVDHAKMVDYEMTDYWEE